MINISSKQIFYRNKGVILSSNEIKFKKLRGLTGYHCQHPGRLAVQDSLRASLDWQEWAVIMWMK